MTLRFVSPPLLSAFAAAALASPAASQSFGAQQVITTSANGADSVYATDLDGDGYADVLSASYNDDKIAWYENRVFVDCNGNGINDPVDINSGASGDCNANGIPDECEIASGTEFDCNGNGVPDSCELIGTRYCTASANSSGLPGRLTIFGSDLLSQNDVTLTACQLPLQSFGFFITSQTPASINPVTNSQGTLCVTGSVGRYVGPGQIVNSGTIGAVALPIDLAAMPTPTGLVAASMFSTWYFQLWHRDANPTLTSNFTDAVAVTFL